MRFLSGLTVFVAVVVLVAADFGGALAQTKAQSQSPDRGGAPAYDLLLSFYDNNERALVYHRLCIEVAGFPPQSFLDNANIVAVELQRQVQIAYPDRTPEDIERGLLARSDFLRRASTQIVYERGCYDAWGEAIRQHLELITRMDGDLILSFIANRV